MDLVIAISFVTGLALALVLFLLVRKVAFHSGELPVTSQWIDELSPDRYRPMMRLLDGDDIAFLKTQPGFTPEIANQLRRQRCQIFRGYLRCLNNDFGRVCAALKLVMLQSRHDRPDLASALLRHQAMFAAGMVLVYSRLLLYRFGIGTVNVASLVGIFDAMRIELRTLVPSAMGVAA